MQNQIYLCISLPNNVTTSKDGIIFRDYKLVYKEKV